MRKLRIPRRWVGRQERRIICSEVDDTVILPARTDRGRAPPLIAANHFGRLEDRLKRILDEQYAALEAERRLRLENEKLEQQLQRRQERQRKAQPQAEVRVVRAPPIIEAPKPPEIQETKRVFNRSQYADKTRKFRKFNDDRRGNLEFFNLSGSFENGNKVEKPAGMYRLRPLPPHPQYNPDGIVHRGTHNIGDKGAIDKYTCQTTVDGGNCPTCDLLEQIYEADPDLKNFSDEQKDIIANMGAWVQSYVWALLIEEPGQVYDPPKPVVWTINQESILRALDDGGLMINPLLSHPTRGSDFLIQKEITYASSGRPIVKYKSHHWEPKQSEVKHPELAQLLGDKYPHLSDWGLKPKPKEHKDAGKGGLRKPDEQHKLFARLGLSVPTATKPADEMSLEDALATVTSGGDDQPPWDPPGAAPAPAGEPSFNFG